MVYMHDTSNKASILTNNKSKFYLIVLAMRPNVSACIMDLEYTHYEPDTPKNDLFQLYKYHWQDMLWFIVEIPQADRHLAEAMAQKYHLRIVDGIPTIIGDGKVSHFPLEGDNVWCIENTNNKMSPPEEQERCTQIQSEFRQKIDALAGLNFSADPIIVKHASLKSIDNSLYRKSCPVCYHGTLLVRRNNKTFVLEEIDVCILCGQHVKYQDIDNLRSKDI